MLHAYLQTLRACYVHTCTLLIHFATAICMSRGRAPMQSCASLCVVTKPYVLSVEVEGPRLSVSWTQMLARCTWPDMLDELLVMSPVLRQNMISPDDTMGGQHAQEHKHRTLDVRLTASSSGLMVRPFRSAQSSQSSKLYWAILTETTANLRNYILSSRHGFPTLALHRATCLRSPSQIGMT